MNNGFYEFSRGGQETATTSSVFPYTGSAIITGSLGITGSLSQGSAVITLGSFSHAEGQSTKTGIYGAYQAEIKDNEVTLLQSYGNITSSFTGKGQLYIYDEEFDQQYRWNSVYMEGKSYSESKTMITISGDRVRDTTKAYVGDLTKLLTDRSWGGDKTIPAPSAHAEGIETIALGQQSHAEGYRTIAAGMWSHAEGYLTLADSTAAHAEGTGSRASGPYSHAEGYSTVALGTGSHAEGSGTTANGIGSHAEGSGTTANGIGSHAEGLSTVAEGPYQHVQGQYNITSTAQSAFIIGNGTADNARSNLVFASGSQFQITGSLRVSGSITGSLFGTASFATSASFATTASYISPTFISASAAASGFGSGGGSGPISVTGSTLYSNSPSSATSFGTVNDNSIFLGNESGYLATSASYSTFLGYYAGRQATNAGGSNFIGSTTGFQATNAKNSNFIGNTVGVSATNASESNFIGTNAGYQAPSASYSNLIGYGAGREMTGTPSLSIGPNNIIIGTNLTLAPQQRDSINLGGIIFATGSYSTTSGQPFSGSVSNAKVGIGTSTPQYTLDVSGSLRVTNGITGSLFGTSSWAQRAISSSHPISVSGSTLYSTSPAAGPNFNTTGSVFLGSGSGYNASGSYDSNFFGTNAGFEAPGAYQSNFFGYEAGYGASTAWAANFIGYKAGQKATNAYGGIFIGYNAGLSASNAISTTIIGNSAGVGATDAGYSNFIGIYAGEYATNASSSNFFGPYAGRGAASASDSNFMGYEAGLNAINGRGSNFIGYKAGNFATSASYSNLIGFQAGLDQYPGTNSIGSNNIIIGTNITLPARQKDSINLGGIIFATGSYSDTNTIPFIGAVSNAKVGIGTSTPQYTLDVSGSTRINDILILEPRITTPGTPINGMVIVSGSGVDQHIYCYLNSIWKQLDN